MLTEFHGQDTLDHVARNIQKAEGYLKLMDKSNNDKQMNGVQYYGIDALPIRYMHP